MNCCMFMQRYFLFLRSCVHYRIFCTMSEIPISCRVGDKRRNSGNESLKRLKLSTKELHEDPQIVLKHRNYLKFLSNRELGVTAGIQAEREFYQIKTSQKEKVSSSNISLPFTYDSCEVNFIKGDDKSLFGVWCVSNGHNENNYVMGEISYDIENEGYIPETYRPCKNIIDMCRGPTDFLSVCNDPPGYSPSFYDILNVRMTLNEQIALPWYCCCHFDKGATAIFGGDGFAIFVSLNERHLHYRLPYPGKVCTLSLHQPSPYFLLGLDIGEFLIVDPRTPSSYFVKISDKAINDSVFVNDREVIVTDVEGKLVKVDLRTRKTSAMFFGHKHSVTKRPFSVANDMLCATGADNVVRIWHISGGYPILVQKSTTAHEVRGWLNNVGNKTYLHYFEKDTVTAFRI